VLPLRGSRERATNGDTHRLSREADEMSIVRQRPLDRRRDVGYLKAGAEALHRRGDEGQRVVRLEKEVTREPHVCESFQAIVHRDIEIDDDELSARHLVLTMM